jgi:hypothetical protein
MRVSHAFLLVALGTPLAVSAVALPQPATAAIYSQAQALTAQAIQEFIANPDALLTQYPEGGAEMISRVRDLSASDPATLNPIIGLLAKANGKQAGAIGTGLGQTALMAVKTDQAYANEIQTALAKAMSSPPGNNGRALSGNTNGPQSTQSHIGDAITTKNQVEGQTEQGQGLVSAGSAIYLNEVVRTGADSKAEMLLADRTNLTVAPQTVIRLDKFVYDPNGQNGVVELVADSGAFRFITGLQPHQDYAIKTPFATIGVRGTEFIVNITPDGVQIQLISGELTITTVSGQTITMNAPNTVVTVSSNGTVQGPSPSNAPIVNFADLGPPTTNITVADALAAFNAVTGDQGTAAATGGGGGGGGGSVTAFSGGGGGGTGGNENLSTFVVNTPSNFFSLSFTSSSSSPGNTPNTPVSPF